MNEGWVVNKAKASSHVTACSNDWQRVINFVIRPEYNYSNEEMLLVTKIEKIKTHEKLCFNIQQH